MREREQPMIQTMKVSDARAQFSQVLNEVFRRQKRVLVEKSGIPVAALVSADDLELLQRMEAQRREDFKIVQESRAAFQDVPDEELQRQVNKAVAEARSELAAERKRAAKHA